MQPSIEVLGVNQEELEAYVVGNSRSIQAISAAVSEQSKQIGQLMKISQLHAEVIAYNEQRGNLDRDIRDLFVEIKETLNERKAGA